jgi:hypothetical protein
MSTEADVRYGSSAIGKDEADSEYRGRREVRIERDRKGRGRQ